METNLGRSSVVHRRSYARRKRGGQVEVLHEIEDLDVVTRRQLREALRLLARERRVRNLVVELAPW